VGTTVVRGGGREGAHAQRKRFEACLGEGRGLQEITGATAVSGGGEWKGVHAERKEAGGRGG